jgi:anti-sigma factor RsiW
MHEEVINRILLAHSGELPPGERDELQKHLAGCEDCRRYQDDLQQIAARSAQALPAGSPSPSVLAAIRAEAERRTRSPRILRFPLPLARALACAAAFLIVLAGWYALVSNGHAERAQAIEAILAVTHEDNAAMSPDASASDATSKEERLQSLARQLLRMEGLSNGDVLSHLEI